MPRLRKTPRQRRPEEALRVELPEWVKLISRREEQQLRRDWLLGFTMGNVLFRSSLNMCRTVYSYASLKRDDGSYGFTAAELEKGAIEICEALNGTSKDLDDKFKR